MSMPGNEMDDIINDFITESTEGLDSLDQKFIELEKNPGDVTLLNDIFRSIHTIKGASGFLGFQQMVDVTHVTEDVLNKLRKGEMAVTASIMDAILQSVDLIKVLLNNIRERNGREENTSPVIEALKGVLSNPGAERTGKQPGPSEPQKNAAQEPKGPVNIEAEAKASTEPPRPEERADDRTAKAASKGDGQAQPKEKEREQSIRVDIDRLDTVLNLAGELVLSRNRLMRLGSKLNDTNVSQEFSMQVNEAISQLDLVTSDLQLAVMKMRMQPIAKVFNKFPRMVRDLARQTGKEVELAISGEETELDKTVIEEIGDPLVHLIRNSVDHGMETPEERVARGKPKVGTVSLSAYQEGRNIIVSVADDGKGIDPAAVKRSAVEKGLITAEDAEKMTKKEALNLIFIPGFSTAKNVSNISGRGVGMDVVKTNITRINGTIHIDSEIGKGTEIIFRLPLTLAIIQALTVEAAGEIYGIPLSTVIENIRVTPSDIKTVDGKEVIHMREHVYPVIRLGSIVTRDTASARSSWKYIVIMAVGEKKFGLLVDKLHGQEEIVMKSMGEYLKGTEGIAGACINGDGNVILILDLAGLLETNRNALMH